MFPQGGSDVLLETGRDRLATQLSFVDAVDSKLGYFVATGSTLIGIAAAILALRSGGFGAVSLGLFALSGLAYLVLCAVGFWGYRRREWATGPRLGEVWDLAWTHSEEELKWRVALAYVEGFDRNAPHEKHKLRALTVCWGCLLVETGSLVAALCLVAALS